MTCAVTRAPCSSLALAQVNVVLHSSTARILLDAGMTLATSSGIYHGGSSVGKRKPYAKSYQSLLPIMPVLCLCSRPREKKRQCNAVFIGKKEQEDLVLSVFSPLKRGRPPLSQFPSSTVSPSSAPTIVKMISGPKSVNKRSMDVIKGEVRGRAEHDYGELTRKSQIILVSGSGMVKRSTENSPRSTSLLVTVSSLLLSWII